MVASPYDRRVSVEEYLAAEAVSEIKHEFVDGYVYAMAGAGLDHLRIQQALAVVLGTHLQSSRCEVLGSDCQVQTSPTRYRYPGVVVTCDERDLGRGRAESRQVAHPTLIVGVLSETTEATDRGAKFLEYQGIPEFREYVLLDSRQIGADHFVRGKGNLWTYQHHDPAATLTLESIGLTRPLTTLYARTELLDEQPSV
jgi:Uma2 family endonuclease